MSTKDQITKSTIARIAGNLLSGKYDAVVFPSMVETAVRTARAIAAEVQRTRPKEEQ